MVEKKELKVMTREEAENLLDEYLDKHETMIDYANRDDYIVWTQEAEDNARSEYMQLKDKLIELICGSEDVEAISRQDALDCLTATGLKKFDFILDARNKIKNLPPVTVQPKIGHWILKRKFPTKIDNEYECSECGRKLKCAEINLIDYPYCHCGAKMEVEESDEKGE
jgi:hypothetical protein